jgi:N-acetylmuramoyl-L-alanine amidase
VKKLVELPGLNRLRISSLDPNEINDQLLDIMAGSSVMCPHLHIPLQSGDDHVLRRMKRVYNTAQYQELVDEIRRKIPGIALTTDIMVGFPGETEAEFMHTYDFLEKIAFAGLHVFKYSPRKGTPAATFPDQVSPEIKEERSNKLIQLGRRLLKNYAENYLGKTIEVLVEQTTDLNGRAMVPLRFVLENLGVKVNYDSSSNVVNIITKDGGSNQEPLIKTAVVSENVVNVRSGPGTTYSIITKVKKGDTYQVLSQSSDWYQIAINDETPGWVAGWLVTIRTETSGASRSEEPGEGRDPEIVPEKIVYIDDVDVDVSDGEVYFTVSGDEKLNYTVFSLDNPRRLVVDFFNSILESKEDGEESFELDTELVKGLRMAQYAENQVRIVADVTAPAGLTVVTNKSNEITFKIGEPSIVGKTIVLDPGHASIQPGGWADPGAVGPSNLYEKDVVLDIAQKVRSLLQAKGANVLMTRTGNTTLTLGGRADVANKNGADIFVSIHTNANTSRAINGTSTYFYGGVSGQYEARQKLAKSIQQELVKSAQRRNIGVLQASFAVLRYTKVPSVLVETAFISNYEEEKLLADPEFRQKLAQGIAQGIENYFAY